MAAISYRRTDWGYRTGSAQRMDGLRGLGERVKPDPGDPQRVSLTALISVCALGQPVDAGVALPNITDGFTG